MRFSDFLRETVGFVDRGIYLVHNGVLYRTVRTNRTETQYCTPTIDCKQVSNMWVKQTVVRSSIANQSSEQINIAASRIIDSDDAYLMWKHQTAPLSRLADTSRSSSMHKYAELEKEKDL